MLYFLMVILNIFPPGTTKLFNKIDSEKSEIDFENRLNETHKENMLTFTNFYTGSGVGILDVNNDGFQDIFFGGNQVSSALYLNQQNLTFKNITKEAGVETDRWITGISIVDINQDGFDDIYLSVSGFWSSHNTENILFVNNGDNTFTEKAAEYNLNEKEQTTHTSFFDYDRDGDLDAFLAINPTDFSVNTMVSIKKRKMNGEARSTDKLFRNNGDGSFTDVSKSAGILIEGYSLGLNTSDINKDGWIDILVTNDYSTNDLLYINNGDGTFSNKAGEFFDYTSWASMGNDVGDINNDALLDVFNLDMLPESSYRQKIIDQPPTYDSFKKLLDLGYEPQFIRNMLHLNNGNNTFSEIGQLANIDQSDWSWCPLLIDLNNDGYKDLFITTGFKRDVGDLDFMIYDKDSPFSREGSKTPFTSQLKAIKKRKGTPIINYVFKNNSDLTFSKVSHEWGFDEKTFSNGATVADLDNDGDLDIIISNIDREATVYENLSDRKSNNHYIKIKLKGPSSNRSGTGAKVTVYHDGIIQYIDNNPYRGYMSSVDRNILFGTGKSTRIDSIEVVWTNNVRSRIYDLKVDTVITIDHHTAIPAKEIENNKQAASRDFIEITSEMGIHYKHKEDPYVDFYKQPLLPHQHSRFGPGIAVGDINEDGLDDFFVGGARGSAGTLFFQAPDATFRSVKFPFGHQFEDMGVLLFDFDNDNDLDLYVVSGGNFRSNNPKLFQDRLYVNLGKGKFFKSKNLIPEINSSGSIVTASDFDGDNDLDLFIGGRVSPGRYPVIPKSYLLENQDGRFIDVTEEKAPGLKETGMVTAALWTDFTENGNPDLLVAGEWMPVTVYENENGYLKDITQQLGLENSTGWWNSINAGDINKDGNVDYILGNFGLNHGYNASKNDPLKLFAKDFDNNGSIETILTMKYVEDYYPVAFRNVFLKALFPKIMTYKTYESYARTTARELLNDLGKENAIELEACNLANHVLIKHNNDSLQLKPLPVNGQFSPVFGTVNADIDADGTTEFLMVGNLYSNNVAHGPLSAFTGGTLVVGPENDMKVVRGNKNGFYVPGDAKSLASLVLADGRIAYIVGNNNDSLRVFSKTRNIKKRFILKPLDAYAIIEFNNGTKTRKEFYYGSGYLSQSTRSFELPPMWKKITVITYSREKRILTSEDIAEGQ